MNDLKLDFAIICDNAFLDANGKLNINGVFDTIKSTGFPAAHKNMSIVIKMKMPEGLYNEIVKIKRNGSDIVSTPETKIKKDKSGTHQFIHHFINTIFPEAGDYAVEIQINGNLIETSKLILEKIL